MTLDGRCMIACRSSVSNVEEFLAMDRRRFVGTCSSSVACLSAAMAIPSFGADARPRHYARVRLTDGRGEPLKASHLKPLTNYVFHYPYQATPVFLLRLDRPAVAQTLQTRDGQSYVWPGGVGPGRAVVAFSAICAHQLVYPTPQVSFISFRKVRAQKGVADNLIHCCAEHSQYDPAQGARVLDGPAEQPLCAVLLEHDPRADTLTAYATLGGELFDAFFRKYEFKLSLDVGPLARQAVTNQAAVVELERFCRNPIQC